MWRRYWNMWSDVYYDMKRKRRARAPTRTHAKKKQASNEEKKLRKAYAVFYQTGLFILLFHFGFYSSLIFFVAECILL